MTDDTPQSNFQSNQNFDPDVKKMFKHFITGGHTPDDNETQQNIGIDDLRGQISVTVTNQNTENLVKALNLDPSSNTSASTPNTTSPVQLAQESRCHTLYRIIGLPVVTEDKSDFYNPGLDIVMGDNITRAIDINRKLRIAKKVGQKFEAISSRREQYSTKTSAIFSISESVEAGVLSLTSGTFDSKGTINKRKFAQGLSKTSGAFDFSPDHQYYSTPGNISATSCLVGINSIRLADFHDKIADPNQSFKPNPNLGGYDVLFGHHHIIVPFMVDPRIDFSIWAAESKTSSGISKRVAVPFVPDASFLKIGSTATAERPLLEKVIRDRFSQSTVQDAGLAVTETVNYIKSSKEIQSIKIGTTPIGDIFSGSVYKTSQQQAFVQYVFTIQALMRKLSTCMQSIQVAQGSYYWLPVPSTTGPESGCTIRDIRNILSKNISQKLITPEDLNLIDKVVNSIMSDVNTSITQPTATPDPGSFAFSNYKLTFDSSTSNSQGDLIARSKEQQEEIRNSVLGKASDSLQIIEMIMGEFSGLGLADMVAIIGALYIMPINDLLGFLDDDAIVRAETSLGQPSGSLKRSGIDTSMTSLYNTVNAFYQIMDQVFQEEFNNNAGNL